MVTPQTKLQWSIIWATTLLCTIFWLRKDPGPESFILPGVLVAALFLWQASADFRGTKESSFPASFLGRSQVFLLRGLAPF